MKYNFLLFFTSALGVPITFEYRPKSTPATVLPTIAPPIKAVLVSSQEDPLKGSDIIGSILNKPRFQQNFDLGENSHEKTFVKDYESPDGSYKYHSEAHFTTNTKFDGFVGLNPAEIVLKGSELVTDLGDNMNWVVDGATNFISNMFADFPSSAKSVFHDDVDNYEFPLFS